MAKKKAKAAKKANTKSKSKKPAAKKTSKAAAKKIKTAAPQKASKAKATPKSAAKTKSPKGKAGSSLTKNLKKVATKAVVTAIQSATKAVVQSAKGSKKQSSPDLTDLFSPLDDRIVIEEIGASDRTPGGLFIPDTASDADRPSQGRVLAVGRGHREKTGRLRPLDVQLGDTVLFEKYSGSGISIMDTEYMVLRESNVLGILNSRQNR